MALQQYLPSPKFIVMVGALALSVGLVVAAEYVSHPRPQAVLSATSQTTPATDWQSALQEIETNSGVSAPTAPDPAAVNTLLTAAKSDNLTTQIGRTLFVSLSDAKSQGLGDDTPTQDQLIAAANAQLAAEAPAPAYTTNDLTSVAQTQASLKAYGNGVMVALLAHPEADSNQTYLALGAATDQHDKTKLEALTAIGAGYLAIAHDLAQVPTPNTFVPLQLQLANDYASLADTYADMKTIIDDPLRGLAGVQRYNALVNEASRLLTTIAGQLSKDGILFNKDEPGSTWNAFLSS